MRQVCIYHAGCPDGFGAAWATLQAWGPETFFVARGHDDPIQPDDFVGDLVMFADIAPPPEAYRPLADRVGQLVVLDHHVSAFERFSADPSLARDLEREGHTVRFDLQHSGAVLTWQHLHPETEVPELLAYVEDQDLWNWKLPGSAEVNAAIASHERSFAAWDAMAAAPISQLIAEGAPIVRANRTEVERSLDSAHPVTLGELRLEAVNARFERAQIGHELASRARYGSACGAVYRVAGTRVDISVYSVGEFDVATLAGRFGGGGHRNAAGFSVTLKEWLERFV